MLKAVIFTGGLITGALALPATFIYIKPIREKIVDDSDFRTELIEVGTEVLAGLITLDEIKKVR